MGIRIQDLASTDFSDVIARPRKRLTITHPGQYLLDEFMVPHARDLLNRLKQLLVLNWRQKSTARSQLKLAIEDVLDSGLPRAYDKPLYEQKCSAIFEHIYESYPERHQGVYAATA